MASVSCRTPAGRVADPALGFVRATCSDRTGLAIGRWYRNVNSRTTALRHSPLGLAKPGGRSSSAASGSSSPATDRGCQSPPPPAASSRDRGPRGGRQLPRARKHALAPIAPSLGPCCPAPSAWFDPLGASHRGAALAPASSYLRTLKNHLGLRPRPSGVSRRAYWLQAVMRSRPRCRAA